MVAIAGYNDDEIDDFIGYITDKNAQLRFIEFMPVGNQYWKSDMMVPLQGDLKPSESKAPYRFIAARS